MSDRQITKVATSSSRAEPAPEPVKRFLQSPLDRSAFDVFFNRCLEVAIGYLRYLGGRGFSLPLQQQASHNPTRDLAIDILGTLLASRAGTPFGIVFDYYRREGYQSFGTVSEDELDHHLTILVRSHVRQELSKLRKLHDPQIENLKRRVNDVLKDARYQVVEPGGSPGRDRISLTMTSGDTAGNTTPWTNADLRLVAEMAYNDSHSRSQWCQRLFESIDADQQRTNWVQRHQLLAVMIDVCKSNQLFEIAAPVPTPTDSNLSNSRVQQATKTARGWLWDAVLVDFIEKERLTESEAGNFLAAFDTIVKEGTHHGTLDKLPVYFRRHMPKNTHSRYLSRYKYVFETAVKSGLGYLAELLSE